MFGIDDIELIQLIFGSEVALQEIAASDGPYSFFFGGGGGGGLDDRNQAPRLSRANTHSTILEMGVRFGKRG